MINIKQLKLSGDAISEINSASSNAHRVRRLKKSLGLDKDVILEEYLTEYDVSEEVCPFCHTLKKIKSFTISLEEIEVDEYTFDTKTCKGLIGHKCPKNSLNANSVDYIKIEHSVNSEEAMKILKSRNSSPFYRENHQSNSDYKNSQRRDEIFWGIVGSSEYFISTKEYGYKLYDFTIPKFNMIIEYHGSAWHFNKNFKYKEGWTSPFNNYTLDELKSKDDLKRKIAEDKGFKVFEIFDTDNKVIFKDNIVQYIKGMINGKK